MDWFLQQLINGLALGAIYALIALGYTMVYGVLRFINFAHCDVLMLGAFAAFFLAPAIGAMRAAAIGHGRADHRAARRADLRGHRHPDRVPRLSSAASRPKLTVLITAIGVSLVHRVHLPARGGVRRGHEALPQAAACRRISIWAASCSAAMTSWWCWSPWCCWPACGSSCSSTKMGTAMRAVSFNQQAAALMGVNINRIISFTFGLGSALAAVAGILYALKAPGIEPLMGVQPGLRAFVAAVLGGIGNLPGAALGGLLLGLLETFAGGISGPLELPRWHRLCDPHPDPALQTRRPARQSPRWRKSDARESAILTIADSLRLTALAVPSAGCAGIVLAVVASMFSAQFNRYYLGIAIDCGINIILAVSLNLINGHTGQFSLGHAGFMAVGGYSAAKLTLVCAAAWCRTRLQPVLFLVALVLGGLHGGHRRSRRRHSVAAIEGRLPRHRHARLRRNHPRDRAEHGEPSAPRAGSRASRSSPRSAGPSRSPPSPIYVVAALVNSTYGRGFIAVHDDEVAASSHGHQSGALQGHRLRHRRVLRRHRGRPLRAPQAVPLADGLRLPQVASTSSSWSSSAAWAARSASSSPPSCSRCCPRCCAQFADYRMIIYSLLIIGLMMARPQGLFTFGTEEEGSGAGMSEPLLELDKVTIRFGGLTAVGDFSLQCACQ